MAGQDDFLRIQSITKTYGVVRALTDVSFSVRRGEIHTVLGENGAGKSTLMKIISGETAPDSGAIELDGQPVPAYTPAVAHAMGIRMVHQELAVFENLTVAENMFPGFHDCKMGRIDVKKLHRMTQAQLDLFGLKTITPTQQMGSITLGGQQIIEILRSIGANPKVIILDEPTSGLNDSEADQLMSILKQLKDKGLTIIYISHRLKEIMRISDRVTVLRDGEYVATFDNGAALTEADLINSMVGRDLSRSLYSKKAGSSADHSAVVFEAVGLFKKQTLRETHVKLHRGEVVGVFGLEGSGVNRLSRILYGIERKDRGEVRVKGVPVKRLSPRAMVARRVMYLNNNRKIAGLALNLPVSENISMPILKRISSALGFIHKGKQDAVAERFVDQFAIALPSLRTRPRQLSGGNQQKVMLSACLAPEPEILIVNEPTRGVDVGAKAEIHTFLLKIATEGVGVMIFSSEMPELMKLCDRILIMRGNGIVGEIPAHEFSEQRIMQYAAVGEAL